MAQVRASLVSRGNPQTSAGHEYHALNQLRASKMACVYENVRVPDNQKMGISICPTVSFVTTTSLVHSKSEAISSASTLQVVQ